MIRVHKLTAMYCHPLLTRTSNASSSMMYAMVPTGVVEDICKEEGQNVKASSGIRGTQPLK